jgi:hypothetical protein
VSDKDIFSALAKYNSARDENYLTEAFVFLINYLLSNERPIGTEILNKLCVRNNEFYFDIDEVITVSTQEVTEQGTPDIKIFTPDKLIYIEVKHDSSLGYKQISRYKKAIESSVVGTNKVILLTRFNIDIEEEIEKPYKHVRWFEIYNWLADAKTQDSVAAYLIEQFKSFLEVKQMSIQKVGWEYINGIPALNNLINMIEVAIQGASLDVYQKSAAWDAKGFYVESTEFWCGIHYDNPLILSFNMMHKTKYNRERLKESRYELREGRYRLWFRLPLEEIHFFSLDKDEQLEKLTKFVKIAYADAQKMRVKE